MPLVIEKITDKDRDDIRGLVTDNDVMKYVGGRKIWDNGKLDKFMKYTLKEYESKSRDNIFMKIVDDKEEYQGKTFVGLVGIHKYEGEDGHSITIMLKKESQGKGIGTSVISLILDEFHKINDKIQYIISDTLDYNIAAQKSLIKAGFIFQKNIERSGKKYKRYHYIFELHDIIKYDYPYLHYFMTQDAMIERFKKLQKYKPDFKQRDRDKFGFDIVINYDIDKEYNRITDWFTDICRARCIFKTSKSTPYDYYKKNKGNILSKSLIPMPDQKHTRFDYDKFEDTIYNSVKMCNNFQLTIVINIYRYFNAKKILDSSAGWGDRLIAALACGASYTGVDPSSCLAPLYKKIIKTLSPEVSDKLSYTVIGKPFEKVTKDELGKSDYDLAFTSPPFFDLEIYNDDNTQSVIGHKTQKAWVTNFLNVLADINIHYLKVNGYFVIYVPEYGEFMEYMRTRKDLEYCGDIVYYYTHANQKKRKIMVWKKIGILPHSIGSDDLSKRIKY